MQNAKNQIRTRRQDDIPFFPNMLNNGKVEVCLKDDVDKVLAEKDAEIQKWKSARNECERQFQAQVEETGKYLSQIIELKNEIAELRRRYRLRLASTELPADNDNVYVILKNGWETTDRYDHDKGHWHYHPHMVKYWGLIQRTLEDK